MSIFKQYLNSQFIGNVKIINKCEPVIINLPENKDINCIEVKLNKDSIKALIKTFQDFHVQTINSNYKLRNKD